MHLQPALDREHYVSPDSWLREREQVLLRSWTCAGRLDELGLATPDTGKLAPKRLAVVEVLGESILVTTDPDGRLHAHYNVCRHRGSQVVPVEYGGEPVCRRAAALRCPYHSWVYELDGRLKLAPHLEDAQGGHLETADLSLHRVGVDRWGGFLWLNLTDDPDDPDETLIQALGRVPEKVRNYPLDSLVVGRTVTYHVAANWKVIAENYNECYHCGPVHPELTKLVPQFGERGGANLAWTDGIPHRDGAWTFTMTGTSERAPFGGLSEREKVTHKGELVYPNLLLSLAAEHVAAFRLVPTAADRTAIVYQLLFAADEVAKDTFDPMDAAELWELTNAQDWAICEGVQRGMSSRGYRQGWYAPMEDASLDIRRWLLPRLGLE
ncbi:MAG: aromatic ring-hydroxylating oxygenase subunit alpha [Nocardioides sp.]